MNVLKKLSRGYDRFLAYWFYLPAAMMAALLVICALMVCLRKVLVAAFNWTDEAMRYLMVYSTFLSLPLLVAGKRNITIDLTDLFFARNPRGQKLFHLLAEGMTLFCCAVLLPVIVTFMKSNMTGSSPAMQLPMWLVYSCLPIGYTLSVLASINNIFKMLTDGQAPAEQKEE